MPSSCAIPYEFQKAPRSRPRLADRGGGAAARAASEARHLPAAVLSPSDHQVENRQLARALAEAARRAGVVLHEHCPVREVDLSGGRAAGSSPIAAAILPMSSSWRPARGRARSAASRPRICRRCARSRGRCWRCRWTRRRPLLAPCASGCRTAISCRGSTAGWSIGATVEERGFDDRLTAGGLLALIEGAWRAVPAIEELPIAETWVGFRPGSRDDAPMLGPSGIDRSRRRHRPSSQRHPADPGHAPR